MSRINLLDNEAIPEDLRASLKKAKKRFGVVPNIGKVYATWPEYYRVYWDKFSTVMADDSDISKRMKLMIMSLVGSLNQCQYAYFWNQMLLRQDGASPEEINVTLGCDFRNSGLDVATKAALGYAEKITNQPYAITDREVERLKEHFNDRQIFEIAAVASFANEMTRMAAALGLQLESR